MSDIATDRALPPRYHITDPLWNSFTMEGIDKTIEALLRHGEPLRHPENFTVRVSSNALWNTDPAFFVKAEAAYTQHTGIDTSQWHSAGSSQQDVEDVYDFHHTGYKGGSVIAQCTMTQTMRLYRPDIPLAGRAAFQEQVLKIVSESMHKVGQPCVVTRQWWERNWAYTEYDVIGKELAAWVSTDFPEHTARVLIACLHERTVRRVMIEPPAVPKSAIARKLAARRGDQPDLTPETALYVPARVYERGSGTHASPHLHYRSPHWRAQPYGPRSNSSYRDVWIEGMFINAENCTEAERAEVKIQRPRNFKLLGV